MTNLLSHGRPIAGTAIYSQALTPRSWHQRGSLSLLFSILHFLILFWPACNYFLHLSVQEFRFFWLPTCLLQVITTLKSLPTLQRDPHLQPTVPPCWQTKWKPISYYQSPQANSSLLHLDLGSWIIQARVRTSSFNSSFILKHGNTDRHLSQWLNSQSSRKTKMFPFLQASQFDKVLPYFLSSPRRFMNF